jgi:hypothetical protein
MFTLCLMYSLWLMFSYHCTRSTSDLGSPDSARRRRGSSVLAERVRSSVGVGVESRYACVRCECVYVNVCVYSERNDDDDDDDGDDDEQAMSTDDEDEALAVMRSDNDDDDEDNDDVQPRRDTATRGFVVI